MVKKISFKFEFTKKKQERILINVIKLKTPETKLLTLTFEKDVKSIVKKFIEMNTYVSFLNIWKLNDFDFSQELKFNDHMNRCENSNPWIIYYMERNIHCLDLLKRFKAKPILKVKTTDISFQFQ
jgi:hypothetical protein